MNRKQERKEACMRYNNQLSEVLQKWHRNNGGDKIKKKKLADLNRIMEQIPHL